MIFSLGAGDIELETPTIIFNFFDGVATYTDIIGWKVGNGGCLVSYDLTDGEMINEENSPINFEVPFSTWTFKSEGDIRDEREEKSWILYGSKPNWTCDNCIDGKDSTGTGSCVECGGSGIRDALW